MPGSSSRQLAERLAEALARLDPRERDVYLLGAVEGLSNVEIAVRLGATAAEVEKLLASALCNLDRALKAPRHSWWRFW